MNRNEILSAILEHEQTLREMGVKSLDLFGSVARDEASVESDIDLLVEFEETGGFFQLFRVKYYLEDLLGRTIDLGTANALREHAQESALKESIRVF
ncbi:MAG: nucleotidyltransferase family protein [Elainellaceae cyanobacterium]